MKLSLAGWSLQKLFRSTPPELALIDFSAYARDMFGIDAVELNSPFFASIKPDYLDDIVETAQAAGVKLLNIAVDEKGDLSSSDEGTRRLGLDSYGKWIPVAADMGITAIRANSGGGNAPDTEKALAKCIDSFRYLCDLGQKYEVTILMENHWGISSEAASMVRVMQALEETHDKKFFGTLPDFGNWPDTGVRMDSIRAIMPWAKAVHAKVNDIDENLVHPRFDLAECVKITRAGGYDEYLGIEYEGDGEAIEGVKRSVRVLKPLL